MKPDYEKQLEAEIDARLKELGELTAPATLAPRVMHAIERRSAAPWYQQSWDAWPLPVRLVSFAAMVALFAGLCFGTWELTHGGAGQGNGGLFASWVATVGALWRTLGLLTETASLLLSKLGTTTIVAGIALFFTMWVTFIGLGTVYVRLAMRPAINRIKS